MALRFMESFDHYNAVADLVLGKWTSNGANGFSGGRNGSAKSAYLTNATSIMNKVLDAQQTWVVGFAAQFPSGVGTYQFFRIYDGPSSNQVDLRFNSSDNTLYVTRNGTTLATGSTRINYSSYYYIEFRVKIHDTAGEIQLQINGVAETLSFVSGLWNTQDTQATANATADRIQWTGSGTGQLWYVDDIYICDGTGGAPLDTFLGDCRVQCIMPSGNSAVSNQWVGSDGNSTDNYLLVDETAPSPPGDFVESSTVSDKDLYAFGDITPTTGTVYAVSIVPLAAKTDAGTRKIATVARLSGGTEADSSDITLSTSYNWYPDIRTTKPGSGSWSISDVNGAEFGVKVTA